MVRSANRFLRKQLAAVPCFDNRNALKVLVAVFLASLQACRCVQLENFLICFALQTPVPFGPNQLVVPRKRSSFRRFYETPSRTPRHSIPFSVAHALAVREILYDTRRSRPFWACKTTKIFLLDLLQCCVCVNYGKLVPFAVFEMNVNVVAFSAHRKSHVTRCRVDDHFRVRHADVSENV